MRLSNKTKLFLGIGAVAIGTVGICGLSYFGFEVGEKVYYGLDQSGKATGLTLGVSYYGDRGYLKGDGLNPAVGNEGKIDLGHGILSYGCGNTRTYSGTTAIPENEGLRCAFRYFER